MYSVSLLSTRGGKTWDVSGNARAPLRDGLATPTASSSSTASKKNNENDVEGVMVKGYWFPSLAAAAKAPAGRGIDLSKATVEAAGSAARTEPRQRREDRVSTIGSSRSSGWIGLKREMPYGGVHIRCMSGDSVLWGIVLKFGGKKIDSRDTSLGALAAMHTLLFRQCYRLVE